jgi:hypothetical protein
LETGPEDIIEVYLNNLPGTKVPVQSRTEFEFPYGVFREDQRNYLIAVGRTGDKDFGMAAGFCDLPSCVTECASGNFISIGTEDDPFTGTYDGSGHKISGIKTVSFTGKENGGLFGYIRNAKITGVSIVNGGLPGGSSYVLSSSVRTADTDNDICTTVSGGVVGAGYDSDLSWISNEAAVFSFMGVQIPAGWTAAPPSLRISGISGGIIGISENMTIWNCRNDSDIFSSGYVRIDGERIVGQETPTHIIVMHNDSGGVTGISGSSKIMSSSHIGSLSTSLCIRSASGMTECTDIYSEGHTGGIIGEAAGPVELTNCHADSSMTSDMISNDDHENRATERDDVRGGLIGSAEDRVSISSSVCTAVFLPETISCEIHLMGGIIGETAAPPYLDQVYYSKNGEQPVGNLRLDIYEYARELGRMKKEDYGEKWNFNNLWDVDADGNPFLRPRFTVTFVSDHPQLFSIEYREGPDNGGYTVENSREKFRLRLMPDASRSAVILTDTVSEESIAHDDGEFTVPMVTDGDCVPADRTIYVSVSVNRYTVSVITPLPDDVAAVMPGEIEHGNSLEIRFTTETQDVSKLDLRVSGGHSDVTYRGEGVYIVSGVTDDILIAISGFEDRGDLTFVMISLTAASIAVTIGIVISVTKLISIRRENADESQFQASDTRDPLDRLRYSRQVKR